ncbi:MAG: hypothetical protein K0U79_10180 [Gammaproteobacteria bacterium]|nr:hypothetical protein [Gammaproteobacteria bacterium]
MTNRDEVRTTHVNELETGNSGREVLREGVLESGLLAGYSGDIMTGEKDDEVMSSHITNVDRALSSGRGVHTNATDQEQRAREIGGDLGLNLGLGKAIRAVVVALLAYREVSAGANEIATQTSVPFRLTTFRGCTTASRRFAKTR